MEAVVAADVELMSLRQEEKDLNELLQDPDQALQDDPDFDMDVSQARLNEVYERMSQIAGATAESRASKILHGLGFTDVMQRRSTQSFRWEGGGVGRAGNLVYGEERFLSREDVYARPKPTM